MTRSSLLWCTVINYAILLVWFWSPRSHMTGCGASTVDGFVCPISSSTLFTILGCDIQIGISLFNLVPFVVLSIIRKTRKDHCGVD